MLLIKSPLACIPYTNVLVPACLVPPVTERRFHAGGVAACASHLSRIREGRGGTAGVACAGTRGPQASGSTGNTKSVSLWWDPGCPSVGVGVGQETHDPCCTVAVVVVCCGSYRRSPAAFCVALSSSVVVLVHAPVYSTKINVYRLFKNV